MPEVVGIHPSAGSSWQNSRACQDEFSQQEEAAEKVLAPGGVGGLGMESGQVR